MKTEIKKLRGFVIGRICYFYDSNFNFLFWRVASLVDGSKKEIQECGVKYEFELFPKSKIREEYLKEIQRNKIDNEFLRFFVQDNINTVALTIDGVSANKLEKLDFKKAKIETKTELTEPEKFCFFLAVIFFVNKFFEEEAAAITENGEMTRSIELVFDKNILNSGFCDLLPAAKTQNFAMVNDKPNYSFSWIFHKDHAFFAESRGYLADSCLALKR